MVQGVGNGEIKKPTQGLRKMFTKIATITLAVAFLSAGAFAGGRDLTAGSSSKPVTVNNVTIVAKNQAWPVRGRMTVDSCKLNTCIDI